MLERITPHERKDLLVAWLALGLAFTLVITGINISTFGEEKIAIHIFLIFFVISLLTVGVGFVLHEMAHKFTAMKYGYWAEFQKNNPMLLVAVLLAALVGVVFAAPGATVIYADRMTREENGIISLAGPVTNLLLCIPFFGLVVLGIIMNPIVASTGFWVMQTGIIGLMVNSMLAMFNMLPISVLDGKKVLAWSPAVFVATMIAAFAMLLVSYDYNGSLTTLVSLFL